MSTRMYSRSRSMLMEAICNGEPRAEGWILAGVRCEDNNAQIDLSNLGQLILVWNLKLEKLFLFWLGFIGCPKLL